LPASASVFYIEGSLAGAATNGGVMNRWCVRQNTFIFPAVLVAAAALFGNPSAHGDVFVLAGGGQIRGTWLNRSSRQVEVYEIETEHGGRLTLSRASVKERIAERPEETEYQRIAPTFGDTIDAQWQLAEWCRENGLPKQRADHLARVIELDPDHGPARRGLGYSHVDGRWVTREGFLAERGYEHHAGRYRTPQEAAAMKLRQDQQEAERKWLARLVELREQMAGPDPYKARDEILAIRDPHALPGLILITRQDGNRRAKLVYLEAIRNVGGFPAAKALVEVSLNDPDLEVFHESIEQLALLRPSAIDKPYVDALQDKENFRVNRAAFALGRLQQKSAVGPLIESLATTHTFVIPSANGPDGISTTFTPPPPGHEQMASCRNRGTLSGLSAGDQTKVISVRVNNPEVLTALVKLSEGITFGFDQQAWHNWHQQQHRSPAADADLAP
jgi:hypothetical protein